MVTLVTEWRVVLMSRILEPIKTNNKINPILKHTTVEQAKNIYASGIAIEVNDGMYVKFVQN